MCFDTFKSYILSLNMRECNKSNTFLHLIVECKFNFFFFFAHKAVKNGPKLGKNCANIMTGNYSIEKFDLMGNEVGKLYILAKLGKLRASDRFRNFFPSLCGTLVTVTAKKKTDLTGTCLKFIHQDNILIFCQIFAKV